MNLSKMSLEALRMRREELIYNIDSHKRDLEIFPETSPLGRKYLECCIEYKTKKLEKIIKEIKKRENINKM